MESSICFRVSLAFCTKAAELVFKGLVQIMWSHYINSSEQESGTHQALLLLPLTASTANYQAAGLITSYQYYLEVPTKEVMLHQDIHHFWFENRRLLEWQTNTQTHVILCVCVCVWEDMWDRVNVRRKCRSLTSFLVGSSQSWERLKANFERTLKVAHINPCQ